MLARNHRRLHVDHPLPSSVHRRHSAADACVACVAERLHETQKHGAKWAAEDVCAVPLSGTDKRAAWMACATAVVRQQWCELSSGRVGGSPVRPPQM